MWNNGELESVPSVSALCCNQIVLLYSCWLIEDVSLSLNSLRMQPPFSQKSSTVVQWVWSSASRYWTGKVLFQAELWHSLYLRIRWELCRHFYFFCLRDFMFKIVSLLFEVLVLFWACTNFSREKKENYS